MTDDQAVAIIAAILHGADLVGAQTFFAGPEGEFDRREDRTWSKLTDMEAIDRARRLLAHAQGKSVHETMVPHKGAR